MTDWPPPVPFVRVLESFRDPRSTTNPYIASLHARLVQQPGIKLQTFSFPRALLGRYDVFHVHWPEVMMGGHSTLSKALRQMLTTLVLLKLTMSRTAVVRTMHNVEPPTGISVVSQLLLRWFDHLTAVRICLNDRTASLVDARCVTILHGDYCDRYEGLSLAETKPGLIQYFGLVRRYKGVEDLLAAFRSAGHPGLQLRVSGAPSSADLAQGLADRARQDPRVTLEWGFLADQELAEKVRQSELVVLPYRFMHNSGAVLASLSLARPVLVPDTDVNRDLAAEVGAGWVHLFTGSLMGADIDRTLDHLRSTKRTPSPDLHRRDWALAGPAHLDAFLLALDSSSKHRAAVSAER